MSENGNLEVDSNKQKSEFEDFYKQLPPGAFGNIVFKGYSGGPIIFALNDDGWIRVLIDIGENTTSEKIRDCIPFALKARDDVYLFQGPLVRGYIGDLLKWKVDDGLTYKEMADELNKDISELIKVYSDNLMKFSKIMGNEVENDELIQSDKSFFDWMKNDLFKSEDNFKSQLSLLKFKENEIKKLKMEGLFNINCNRPPFENGYPVTRGRMIRLLRTFKNSKRYELYKTDFSAIRADE